MNEQELRKLLDEAFRLGQTHWQQGDSESPKQWARAKDTWQKFEQLIQNSIERYAQ